MRIYKFIECNNKLVDCINKYKNCIYKHIKEEIWED